MEYSLPRLVIAAAQSGSGKTTVATGLLSALRQRGIVVQSFKVGPDYIDPGYHRLASGRAAHNLDTWLVPKERVPALFAQESAGADIAVVEGVMGLYDGGREGVSSTAEIAKLLKAPVILVIDAKSMGLRLLHWPWASAITTRRCSWQESSSTGWVPRHMKP